MACSTATAGQFNAASYPRTTSSNSSPSQIMMAGQSTTSSTPGGATPGTPSTNGPPQSGNSPGHQSSGGGCCESGRPILTDPITGQTVCSCQYDQLLGYQRLAAAAGSAGISAASMYAANSPYPSAAAAAAVAAQAAAAEQGAAYLPLTAEQSAFYSPTAGGFDLKENLEAWRSFAAYPAMYYPYESPLAGYPFANGYGVDLNGARRKNATRETTSTLKAWLNEHRKNPYPTKGEKIMLAIITKMTLTQVSTWFANARRRLKKENKMTWEPRNRCDDDDDNDGNDTICNSGDEDGKDELDVGGQSDDGDCKDDSLLDVDDSKKCHPIHHFIHHPMLRLQNPQTASTTLCDKRDSLTSSTSSSSSTTTTKPRIWSLVDTATSTSSNQNNNRSSSTSLYSFASGAGKLLPHIAARARLDYASLPYPKPPPNWYGNPALGVVTSSSTNQAYANGGHHNASDLLAVSMSSRIPATFPNGLIYPGRRSPPPPPSISDIKHLIPNCLSTTLQSSNQNRLSSAASVTSSPPSSPETKIESQ